MTDEQIIKAFEICMGNGLCKECPYSKEIACIRRREKDAVDLMKRQRADGRVMRDEISKLQTKIESLEDVARSRGIEISELTYDLELLKQEKSVVKAEAIKEFAERLKKKKAQIYFDDGSQRVIYLCEIDNLSREMVGE